MLLVKVLLSSLFWVKIQSKGRVAACVIQDPTFRVFSLFDGGVRLPSSFRIAMLQCLTGLKLIQSLRRDFFHLELSEVI